MAETTGGAELPVSGAKDVKVKATEISAQLAEIYMRFRTTPPRTAFEMLLGDTSATVLMSIVDLTDDLSAECAKALNEMDDLPAARKTLSEAFGTLSLGLSASLIADGWTPPEDCQPVLKVLVKARERKRAAAK